VATSDTTSSSVLRGIDHLMDTQQDDGTWEETHATGTGFPKVFYLCYHLYRNSFPLLALASFQKAVSDTIMAAAKAVKGERPRVVACGECAPLLWARGNAEAAVRVEHLWDEIAKTYNLDTLCGYPLGGFQADPGSLIFQRICAEHSAVHSQ
jgi:hypothetical protein